jgi:hypothetical protein
MMQKYITNGWFWFSVLGISVGFFLWLNSDQPDPTQIPAKVSRADFKSVDTPPAQAKVNAIVQVKHADPSLRISAQMLAEFNSAQSYRAFIYSAIKHPEHGGYAYALHVLTECGRVEQWENETRLSISRRRALNVLHSRCDMTAAEREDFLREINADKQLNAERDPIFQTMGNLFPSSKNQSERDMLSRQLLEWADPLSLGIVQSREQYTDRNGELRERAFLNGRWYEEPEIQKMSLAWQLANCELGQACGADATETLKICINRGWCASSVQEAVMQGYPDPIEQQKIEVMKRQIINAIQKRDLRAFISPQGNPPVFQ